MSAGHYIGKVLRKYLRIGQKVAELCHGGHSDILDEMSQIVGDSGTVYGLDMLNPQRMDRNLRNNIKLLSTRLPEFPVGLEGTLDGAIVRGPLWMFSYTMKENGDGLSSYDISDPSLYGGLNRVMRSGSHLIVFEENNFPVDEIWGNSIRIGLPNYELVEGKQDHLVYRKKLMIHKSII